MTAAEATSSSDGDLATSSNASNSDEQRQQQQRPAVARQATGTRDQRLKVTSSVAEDQNSELKEFEVDNWFRELESLGLGISDFGVFDNRFGFSVFFLNRKPNRLVLLFLLYYFFGFLSVKKL